MNALIQINQAKKDNVIQFHNAGELCILTNKLLPHCNNMLDTKSVRFSKTLQ